MNYNRQNIERKIEHLKSKKVQRLHKLHLIILRMFIICLVCGVALLCSALFGLYNSIIDSAPDINKISVVPQGYKTSIIDSNGKTIQTLVGKDANRQYVSLQNIPVNLQNAFVAIEDERFWSHNGIDIPGIIRAGMTGISSGSFSQGASTITQQLLKNQAFSGGEEKTFYRKLVRKIQEQYLALTLEKKYDKKQILEYYLNTINLGQNTLGVQAASIRYFNKDVSQLTLSECAVLAGITQNPSGYNPINYPTKNKQKRTTVLTYMKEQGLITSDEYAEAMKDNVYERIQKVNKENSGKNTTTSYFTDALITEVIRDMKNKLGYTETQAYNALYSRGLTIHATIDTTMQNICDRVINTKSFYPKNSKYQLTYQLTVLRANGKTENLDFASLASWYVLKYKKDLSDYFSTEKEARAIIKKFKKDQLKKKDKIIGEIINLVIQPQVSFVLMDQYTGQIKAICGGRGEKTASRTLNRATSSARQPGSTFKILSTYLPALDTTDVTLATVMKDEKYYYPGTKRLVKNWYGNTYRGDVTVRRAIADSMNVIAVKTLEKVTPQVGYDYLLNLGFSTLVGTYTAPNGKVYTDIGYPMALGGLTKGVTNLELTAAFATLANEGKYNRCKFYTKIVDHDGNVLIDNTSLEPAQVVKPSTAWLLTKAMQDVVDNGSGTRAKFKTLAIPEAGKTGTTSSNKDLWFVGYTPNLTAGIWGGYDSSTKQKSASYHKDIWRTIMEQINKQYPDRKWNKPDEIESANICIKCGKLSKPEQSLNVRKEYFAKGTTPTETCICN